MYCPLVCGFGSATTLFFCIYLWLAACANEVLFCNCSSPADKELVVNQATALWGADTEGRDGDDDCELAGPHQPSNSADRADAHGGVAMLKLKQMIEGV